ncbi:MAG: type IV toxin-antitoxin system AbiEi family antitoxin [Alphaproteobacteria bacterium]|nr:type IV toxin-antitoxin system AbiEi family antitoxin [Alphaproteobacteria bacterium]
MSRSRFTLADFVDSLQARGQYFLLKPQAKEALKVTDEALNGSIARLVKKKRLILLKKGFYLIVPLEYKNVEAPPPEWFVDHLMKEHGARYYVGLLTAASLHGVSHQQPQMYQVMTDKVLQSIKIGRARIHFYFKKELQDVGILDVKTPTGYMNVSGPELTAFDLVRYVKQSGYLNHISMILTELGEQINSNKLSKIAPFFPQPCIQKTGYILDYVGFGHKTKLLLKFVQKLPPRYYLLRPDKKWNIENKNTKWHLYINEDLEPDL